MKQTAIYVRVSTFDQANGRDSQKRALRDYCKNHGLTNVVWYEDIVSGASDDRPGFKRLQKAVFDGKVKTVAVWKLDRISRKGIKDGVAILTDWLEKGIRIISTAQQLDFSGQVGQLIASVLFAVAAMERESIRENTKRGLAAAKARGAKLGKRPKLFADDITPLLREGLSMSQVAEKLGKSRQACYDALKREGVDVAAARPRAN